MVISLEAVCHESQVCSFNDVLIIVVPFFVLCSRWICLLWCDKTCIEMLVCDANALLYFSLCNCSLHFVKLRWTVPVLMSNNRSGGLTDMLILILQDQIIIETTPHRSWPVNLEPNTLIWALVRSWSLSLGSHLAGDVVVNPALGCHYFPPGLLLSSNPESIPTIWPVPNYTAWWQYQTGGKPSGTASGVHICRKGKYVYLYKCMGVQTTRVWCMVSGQWSVSSQILNAGHRISLPRHK